MVQVGDGAPFNSKYHDVLKSAFVRRGILSLQAASTISKTKSQAKGMVAATEMRAKQPAKLPKAAIPASHFGLNQSTLQVHVASEPRRLALSASSNLLGPVEPRSSQNAAESYTEDLFQRGHVDVGKYADPESGMSRAFSFRMPSSGNIQNGCMRFASASVALYVWTTHPRCTWRDLPASRTYGASMSHFPPADGTKSPRKAE